MVTWHGIDVIERRRLETILGVSQFYIWLSLLILNCVQKNLHIVSKEKKRSLWRECACTSMHHYEGITLVTLAQPNSPLGLWA